MNALLASAPAVPEFSDDNPPVAVAAIACAPGWRAILEAQGFSVSWHESVPDALRALNDTRPAALITGVLASPSLRRSWSASISTVDHLRRVPWVVIAEDADDGLLDALEAGADDFIVASTESGLFGLRLQALLRMVERLRTAAQERGEPLTGTIATGGPLALLKFCESRRITGRLTINAEDRQAWVLFKDGDLVEAGPESDQDPLDAFLAVQRGSYVIEHASPRLQEGSSPIPPAGSPNLTQAETEPAALPPGRLSRVEYHGRAFQIQTESRNDPDFTITTIIDSGGRTVRKVESRWPHPLRRRSDHDRARADIDRQHDSVTRRMREGAARAPRPSEGASAAVVATATLLWAAYFLTEHVCSHLGTAVADSVLRRAHEDSRRRHPELEGLRIRGKARVELDWDQLKGTSADLVRAVADWMSTLLDDAGRVAHEAGRVDIRETTALMEGPLERIGFYAAFDACRRNI